MASRPETIAKMKKAQSLYKSGQSISSIAKTLDLSNGRIREYLEGINWISKTKTKKKII